MKGFLPLLLLLAGLCAGCAKTEYQYAIVCDFPAEFSGRSWLAVSNDDGAILEIFDLSQPTVSFVGKVDFKARDASDTYNLHLIHSEEDQFPSSSVVSHYKVQNGANVCFRPSQLYPFYNNGPFYRLFIRGIESVDSVVVPGNYLRYHTLMYDAATQTARMDVFPPYYADIVLRVRAAPSAPFHSLYLPTTALLSDSVEVQWSDFSPDAHFATLEVPGNGQDYELEVAAVEPDFTRYTTLLEERGIAPQSALAYIQVPLPAGLNPQALFRVLLRQGEYTVEKTFPPGEALRVEPPGFSIESAVFSPLRSIQVRMEGNPDLVELSMSMPGATEFQRGLHWNIQGPPESFEQMMLPRLERLLPGVFDLQPRDTLYQLHAYQYEQLDIAQLQAGLPYKGNGQRVFSQARYGRKKIAKAY